ncbi:MAG: AAA family ATPase, partial [Actinomycetota bacterium]
ITLVAGVGGLGKSMWLASVAAQLSRGNLDGHGPADTVIVSYEDTAAEVLRQRVEAAGGDPSRVHVIVPEHRDYVEPVALPRDMAQIEQLVRSVETKLIVIDPIVAAIVVELDVHKDQHVRAVLARLAELVEEVDCAAAIVGHLNKAPSTDAYIRVANSVAFWNAARSVVLVTEDGGDDDDLRLVAQGKANYARLHPVERHRIEPITLPHLVDAEDGRPVETARMVFVEYAGDVVGADVLRPRTGSAPPGYAAALFLLRALVDGDWHDSAGLKTLAGADGISERTLQRASKDLGVESERRGFPASTWWRLPQSRQNYDAQHQKLGATIKAAISSGLQTTVAPVAPVAPPPTVDLSFLPERVPADAPEWEIDYWRRNGAAST